WTKMSAKHPTVRRQKTKVATSPATRQAIMAADTRAAYLNRQNGRDGYVHYSVATVAFVYRPFFMAVRRRPTRQRSVRSNSSPDYPPTVHRWTPALRVVLFCPRPYRHQSLQASPVACYKPQGVSRRVPERLH